MPATRRLGGTALVAALGILVTACGGADDASDGASSPSSGGELSGEVVVFAAASLTDAFSELGRAFTVDFPDVDVTFNFAASSELVAQIVEGAPADVYASADERNMQRLVDADGAAGTPVVFATNQAEIIVAPGNPLGIAAVSDLANPDVVLVTCAPEVPCGGYATQIFERAGIAPTPDSLEQNVKAVVTKVTLGEADAGIVYATDVLAAGDDATGVEIPDDLDVLAEYPIALTADAPEPAAGQAFIDFVTSDRGRSILTSYGFTAP